MSYSPGLHFHQALQRRRGLAWARAHLTARQETGDEDPERGCERLGEATRKRPDGPLVWFHAGTAGQAMALPVLIERLTAERDDLSFLITTAAHDPGHPLGARLPDGVIHQFAPFDLDATTRAFLAHWRPDIALWADRDLHPALIEAVHAAQVPLFMIDARMPDKVLHRWRWLPGMARVLLRRFRRVLAADARSAANLRKLGFPGERIEVTGFLQEGGVPLPCVQAERDDLAMLLAARPVWLAAGIDTREDAIVLAAHKQASRRAHRLLLILAPRDRTRGPMLKEALENQGWTVALRSGDEEPEPDIQILIADSPGEMGLWYRLAPTVFMGQSFYGTEPRNPYEAAALGSAVLFGPNPARYRESYARLAEAGAARRVRDQAMLAREVEYLLAADKAAEMAAAAWEVSTSGAEVTDRVTRLIFDTLDAEEA